MACLSSGNEIYLGFVSQTSLTSDELRAAAETHHELGADYQSAVIDSFIDKVGREIDARVDARLAYLSQAPSSPVRVKNHNAARNGALALAIVSIALGIPLTAIEARFHYGIAGLLVVWIALTAINVAYGVHTRPRDDRR